jgi:hypothetical protein
MSRGQLMRRKLFIPLAVKDLVDRRSKNQRRQRGAARQCSKRGCGSYTARRLFLLPAAVIRDPLNAARRRMPIPIAGVGDVRCYLN